MLNRLGPAIHALPRTVVSYLGRPSGMWHTRASSGAGAGGDKLAITARLDLELSKIAREKAEADAVTRKYEIEAEVAIQKGRMEAARAEVEAGAANANAKVLADAAKAGAAKAKAHFLWVTWVSVAAIAAALVVDHYVHESTAFIKLRMLATLRECKLPASLPPTPTVVLPTQRPFLLGFLPVLLLGPSGCGKSTLLGCIASSLLTPAPIVLVRMRLPSSQASGYAPDSDAKALMDAAAMQLYPQIGFPGRRSIVADILSRVFILRDEHTKLELLHESRDRLVAALHLLFEVCEELKLERQKSMSPRDAAPVLLFDEVQDLIKDERLKRAGGQIVLDLLWSLLIGYCVERQAVRAVIAGSSVELHFAFAASTPLRDPRWECFDLEDPDHGAVISALQAGGYSAEEAHSMTNLCGTRLRLLQGPLTRGKKDVSAADFLSKAHSEGRAAFASIFSKLSAADAKLLAKLLDDIEACDSGQGAAKRPVNLPAALHHVDTSLILYVNRERKFYFQSQLHRRTWAQVRDEYKG